MFIFTDVVGKFCILITVCIHQSETPARMSGEDIYGNIFFSSFHFAFSAPNVTGLVTYIPTVFMPQIAICNTSDLTDVHRCGGKKEKKTHRD